MKKHHWLASCVLLGSTLLGSTLPAQAISISGQAGKEFTNLTAGLGNSNDRFVTSLNWAHNHDDGNLLGLNFDINIPLGLITPHVGAKGLYLNPAEGKHGYALAVGGGLDLPLLLGLSAYGSAYWAPSSLTSGIDSYNEMDLGVQWQILKPLDVNVGYRYMQMKGKDGYRNNTLADGAYIGVGLNF